MQISVVIATWGRVSLLAQALDALAEQRFPAEEYEVIVSVDGPDAATLSLLQSRKDAFQRLTWIEAPSRRGPAAARNAALRQCQGEVVAITDDDCIPAHDWLQAIHTGFQSDPGTGVIVGCTTTDRTCLTPFSHYVENLTGQTHQTCNIAYRRALLEQLDGFDERFSFSHEDTDLFFRAQEVTAVRFLESVRVLHPPRELTVRQFAASAYKFEGDFIFAAKHPALYRSRHGGLGPLRATLWEVAVKHVAKRLLSELRWIPRQPGVYFRFLAASLWFQANLCAHAPLYWWRHRKRGVTETQIGPAEIMS